ncbi:hypothetical protein VPNG_10188 [Cytospora leucostoma]|uniref:Uncharacterized protein n=1 Tax=Cytospora leucostoma TaxID=1230097 RepID=A0A423VFK8_9PEZI|nr:hypothetical protein VPNG_10188 [Cytospora leucostoma]
MQSLTSEAACGAAISGTLSRISDLCAEQAGHGDGWLRQSTVPMVGDVMQVLEREEADLTRQLRQ